MSRISNKLLARARWAYAPLMVTVLAACTESATEPTAVGVDAANSVVAMGSARQIVVLEPKANVADVVRRHRLEPQHTYTHVLNGFAATVAEAARAGLLRDSRVLRIVPDEVITHAGDQKNPVWNLDRIDQPLLPLDQRYLYSFTGAGVTAYVVDSGIRYDHQEFGGRATYGFDAFGGDGSDCNGHGTHVAGTLGGNTYGAAKEVRLVSVRMLDCWGRGTLSGLLASVDWILGNNDGPAVANMSLGGSLNAEVNAAVLKLVNAGIQVSVAAGNSGSDACGTSPASVPEVVTVAATTMTDTRAAWSNWGSCVDLFAPGDAVLSAVRDGTAATGYKTGTSMAAPHVAAVMALYLQETPSLTPAELKTLVLDHAAQDVVQDALSDHARMVSSRRSGDTPPPPPPPPPSTTEPPTAPEDLSLKLVSLNRVELEWRDRSSDEAAFIIERRMGAGEWHELIAVGANTTSYADGSVLRDETYTYRVASANAAGKSQPTNEVSIRIACQTKGKSANCR